MDVVLISPVSPYIPRDGHRLAVLSDLHALLDNQLSVGMVVFTYPEEIESGPDLCPTIKIPVRTGGFASRFVRGFLKNLPPSAERLYSPEAHRVIASELRKWSPKIVIVDDASVSGYVTDVRSTLPNTKVVLRSHNVMHDVRTEQFNRSTGPGRMAVALDCQRYIDFERAAVEAADHHWAITPADAVRMSELYGRPSDCLAVSVPLERYECVPFDQGQSNVFVHVGSLDFRRRADLILFLQNCWPRVLEADGSASLILAGEYKGAQIPAHNVIYTGRVKSDTEIYSRGRFSLNFQSSPGGVKLKTLTSLAAGRTLLSTREGVEGVGIRSGTEFFDIDEFLSRTDLKSLLSDPQSTQSVADAGRQYVQVHHSRQAVARQLLNLIEKV